MTSAAVLEKEFHHPLYINRIMLPKFNGLFVEANDAFFFCVYFISAEPASGQLLLC